MFWVKLLAAASAVFIFADLFKRFQNLQSRMQRLFAATRTPYQDRQVALGALLENARASLSHEPSLLLSVQKAREQVQDAWAQWSPGDFSAPVVQRIDELGDRLPRSLAARAGSARGDFNLVAGRLRRDLIDTRIERLSEKLAAAWKMAELVHPERPLSKGFVRVTSRDGRTLMQVGEARAENLLTLHFGDGNVDASVESEPQVRPPVERKARRAYIAPQPGLFDAPEE